MIQHKFTNKHIQPFIDLVTKNQKYGMKVCEVGVLIGETTVQYIDIVHKNHGTLYVIDNFIDGLNPDKNNNNFENIFRQNIDYQKYANTVEILSMNSNQAYHNIKDSTLDICFIDADHSYESVKQDIILYIPKMKPGGIFCGHDITHDGVKRALSELLPHYQPIIYSNNPGDNNMWRVDL